MSQSELRSAYLQQLQNGIAALQLNISLPVMEKMLDFLTILHEWNQKFNLTGIKTIAGMVAPHLLDSLTIAPYLQGQRILDVGTGAGLPGIPLALCFPEKHFVLLDGTGKKVKFLRHIKSELNIPNIEPVQDRAENYQPSKCFDSILFRAVGSMQECIQNAKHLCCPQGEFLFMKGVYPQEELEKISRYSCKVIQLTVPDLDVERHLVTVRR